MRATLRDASSGSRLFSTACVSSVLALVTMLSADAALAADSLFPEPLHLTREITDPISGSVVRVDEYCLGNRIAAVQGAQTAVVDYERGEILSIDRTRATFSISTFAKHAATLPQKAFSKSPAPWNIEPVAPGALVGGRVTDGYIATRESSEISRIEIALDRQVSISRNAMEALLGSSWPNPSGAVLEVLESVPMQMQSKTSGDSMRYPLPIEQRTTYAAGGESLVFSNRVVRVGSELAPSDLVAIPAGFRRVDDVRSARARMLRELDSLSIPGSVQP